MQQTGDNPEKLVSKESHDKALQSQREEATGQLNEKPEIQQKPADHPQVSECDEKINKEGNFEDGTDKEQH